jgi:hypothetical protein
MVLSILFGGVLTVLGAMLLFHSKHLDPTKNKEIAVESIVGYGVLVVAVLCGAISGIIALNTNNFTVAFMGAAEIVAAAIIGLPHFLSWMDSDIHEGYPSN